MKKMCLSLMALICCMGVVNAQVFKGKAVEKISTKSPSEIIKIKALRDLNLGNGLIIEKNSIITGKMTDVASPEKFHKNASFTFIPTSYTDPEGLEHSIDKEVKAIYRQKLKPDFKHSEISFGMSSNGKDPLNSAFFFSPSYFSNTKKIIKGEGKEVWEDYKNRNTPWGYGEDINIKAKEVIYFNFPDIE